MKLMIKNLDMTKALRREDLAVLRGGSNLVLAFGPVQDVQNGGGFTFGSPVSQVAPQTVTPTETNVQIASIAASMNTLLSQAKVL
jgi:hypothetical protein